MGPPALVVIGGLPATGKTTIGRPAAREMRAAYLRIDTIEGAILRGEGRSGLPRGDEGYVIGYELASDQLDLGLDVVVECVNPIATTRGSPSATGPGRWSSRSSSSARTSSSIGAVLRRGRSMSSASRTRGGGRSSIVITSAGNETAS